MIENIEHNVGLLLVDLESRGMLKDTLVVFMNDNGMATAPIRISGKNHPLQCRPERRQSLARRGGHTRAVVLDVEGIDMPASPLQPNGCSLVPLFGNPKADWPDRTLITHVGRWNPG